VSDQRDHAQKLLLPTPRTETSRLALILLFSRNIVTFVTVPVNALAWACSDIAISRIWRWQCPPTYLMVGATGAWCARLRLGCAAAL